MNVFQYSTTTEANWKANLAEMTAWEPQYTFYSDFAIAEFCETYMHDRGAVVETYNNVIKSWGSDYKALTEIIMVLNHKIWAFFGKENVGVDAKYLGVSKEMGNNIARVYNKLWEDAKEEFFKRFKDNEEALDYYYEVTD